MRVPNIIVCILLLLCSEALQAQIDTLQQPGNSATSFFEEPAPLDSVYDSVVLINNNDTAKVYSDGLLIDSSDSFLAPAYLFKPTPRKAVIYSSLFPGLGQIYNRKYWKLPIVYGGFVGLTYFITWNNGYYRDYLNGYRDIMDSNPETNSWHKMLPFGYTPESVDQSWFTDVLKQRKDYFRYYRDLSIIGTVGLYLLAIVDAYVDAQLFDFDMSPDLTMRLAPVVIGRDNKNTEMGNFYGLHCCISF